MTNLSHYRKSLLILSLLVVGATGCGGPSGNASAVPKDLYKKIQSDLRAVGKPMPLEEVLKKHNVKVEDYAAAAAEYLKDPAFVEELNKAITGDMGIAPATGGEAAPGGETPPPPPSGEPAPPAPPAPPENPK